MSFYAVLLLAVALSMDAFAVALASGCALRAPRPRHYFRISAAFGFFQFAMPVVGWYLGVTVRSYIEDWDHWIAFGLLAWIGGKMVHSGFSALRARACCPRPSVDPTAGRNLLVLSVATSIDAFAVGVSFAAMQVNILPAAGLIGCITCLLSAIGVRVGALFVDKYCAPSERIGGIVLFLVGLKPLLM